MRVVDFRGNPVRMKRISGSSLIKAQEWIEFLDAHAETFKDEQPWVTFAVQAIINLHQGLIIMSRRVRKNEYWTGKMTPSFSSRRMFRIRTFKSARMAT